MSAGTVGSIVIQEGERSTLFDRQGAQSAFPREATRPTSADARRPRRRGVDLRGRAGGVGLPLKPFGGLGVLDIALLELERRPYRYAHLDPELLEMADEGLVLAVRARARLG